MSLSKKSVFFPLIIAMMLNPLLSQAQQVVTYNIQITNSIPPEGGVYPNLTADTSNDNTFFPTIGDPNYSIQPQTFFQFSPGNQQFNFAYGPGLNRGGVFKGALPANPVFSYIINLTGYPSLGECTVNYNYDPNSSCSAILSGSGAKYCYVQTSFDNQTNVCTVSLNLHFGGKKLWQKK